MLAPPLSVPPPAHAPVTDARSTCACVPAQALLVLLRQAEPLPCGCASGRRETCLIWGQLRELCDHTRPARTGYSAHAVNKSRPAAWRNSVWCIPLHSWDHPPFCQGWQTWGWPCRDVVAGRGPRSQGALPGAFLCTWHHGPSTLTPGRCYTSPEAGTPKAPPDRMRRSAGMRASSGARSTTASRMRTCSKQQGSWISHRGL